jgi:HlyD family secretion protein
MSTWTQGIGQSLKKGSGAQAPDGIREALIAGAAVVATLVVGVGGWAATAPLSGAVVAQGTVVVDNSVKKVQHSVGGRVGEIRVKDGDKVRQGDLLLRLDETVVRANMQIITKQLDELAIRIARLNAERDGATAIAIPPTLADRQEKPEIAALITGERTLFESRKSASAGQKAQLRERIAQLRDEIDGLTAQQDAKAAEIVLVKKELGGMEQLWNQNLMPISKLTAAQREAARLDGERAHLVSTAASARGKISETELQILQIDQNQRSEVVKELHEAQAKEAELVERRAAAGDQLDHVELRAPEAGVVHQLTAHTVGGVIAPGEQVMVIVPENEALVVESRISPMDIDHVHVGQPASIRLPAFSMRTTPEFEGIVTRISADLTKDREMVNGPSFYVARLALTGEPGKRPEELGLKLIPGMPAEAHIRTGERTALSYLLKPLNDQLGRAFKER